MAEISRDLREKLEDFIVFEARQIDQGRFDDWAALFADDGTYWVPAAPGQDSPHDHVSLFYDQREDIATRVARLNHPQIHVQIPKSRTCHLISNVAVEAEQGAPGEYTVRSKVLMLEYRPKHGVRLFGGDCTHRLRARGDGFEIVMKRVDLVNCDDSFEALVLPI